MMDGSGTESGVEKRLRTQRILWAALFASTLAYAALAYLLAHPEAEDNLGPAVYLFLGPGLAFVAASFWLKRDFYGKAAREQRPELTQTGLILALVLCEAAALLGLLSLLVLGHPYGYLLFAAAAVGFLLHFPRRDPLLAATHKRGF